MRKLNGHETLQGANEEIITLDIAKIFGLRTDVVAWPRVQASLAALQAAMKSQDKASALAVLAQLHQSETPMPDMPRETGSRTVGQAG